MASLAPGNGWFPQRAFSGARAYHARVTRRQALQGSNIYELRRIGIPFISPWGGSARAMSSNIPDLFAAEEINDSHAAASVLAWGVFAAVLSLILWAGCMAAFAGAVVTLGVPWATVFLAMMAVHLLAAVLVALFCVRVSRNFCVLKS